MNIPRSRYVTLLDREIHYMEWGERSAYTSLSADRPCGSCLRGRVNLDVDEVWQRL